MAGQLQEMHDELKGNFNGLAQDITEIKWLLLRSNDRSNNRRGRKRRTGRSWDHSTDKRGSSDFNPSPQPTVQSFPPRVTQGQIVMDTVIVQRPISTSHASDLHQDKAGVQDRRIRGEFSSDDHEATRKLHRHRDSNRTRVVHHKLPATDIDSAQPVANPIAFTNGTPWTCGPTEERSIDSVQMRTCVDALESKLTQIVSSGRSIDSVEMRARINALESEVTQIGKSMSLDTRQLRQGTEFLRSMSQPVTPRTSATTSQALMTLRREGSLIHSVNQG